MDNNTYKPNIEKLRDILTHPQITTVFNHQVVGRFSQVISEMEQDIKIKTDGGNPEVTEEKTKSVSESLNLLLKIVMEKPITPILRDVTNEMIVLSAYWNENVGQDMRVREACHALRRFIDYHLSMMDLIQLSKSLLRKMEQFQNFSPPSFELSRHYLKSLQEMGCAPEENPEAKPKEEDHKKK